MKSKEWQMQLAGLRDGDTRSFRWVYDQEHPRVYGFCLQLIGCPAAAKEVTSDVFVRLWHKRAIIDPSLPISPLLFKITRDYANNYRKRENRYSQRKDRYAAARETQAPAGVEDELVFQDYLRIAESVIRKLPQRQQQIFTLRYRNGLDNNAIARRLGITESTVRVQLHNASLFLRGQLSSHPEVMLFLTLGIFL